MEARLQAAVNELHDAQDALNLEKRNRSPSLTPQLRVDTSPVRHVSFKGASPPAKVVISQETIIQKPVQVPTSLLDTWNELLQKLSGHLQVSNPQAPWARSLLSHNPSDPETLQMRHSILEHLQKALSNLGLNEEQILANWERDPQIKEQLLSLLEKQLVQIEEHAKEDPIFGKTRQLMAQDLDQAVRLYYVPPLLSLSLDNKIQTDAFETAKAEIAYHRRAQSENVTGAKGLPPLPSLSGPRTHWRANTALSFSALQSQILKFVRKRQGSENSELSASPMSTESPKSVLAPASPV